MAVHLYQLNKADLQERLRKIEGQVRGIRRMIDEDRYCVDILTQIAAIQAGLRKVGLTVLEAHTRGCVSSAIREGHGDEELVELMAIFNKFLK